jgi:hypothetical protein
VQQYGLVHTSKCFYEIGGTCLHSEIEMYIFFPSLTKKDTVKLYLSTKCLAAVLVPGSHRYSIISKHIKSANEGYHSADVRRFADNYLRSGKANLYFSITRELVGTPKRQKQRGQ